MKRIICIMLVLCMLMVGGAALAAENLDFMTKTYKSFNADMEISFELKEPLEILNVINDEGFSELGDIKELVASIFESVITMDMSANMSEDYSSMQAMVKMNSNIPFKLNSDFGGNVYFNVASWIDMDLKESSPKYYTVSKTPFSNKYFVMDIFKADPDAAAELAEAFKSLLNKETMEKIQLEAAESIKENAKISYGSSSCTITFDDVGAKKYVFDMLELVFETEAMKKALQPLAADVSAEFTQMLSMAETMLENIKLFDSIVLEYELDKDGYIIKEEGVINFNFNIHDIMAAFGSEDEYITKENSNINFAVKVKAGYNDINKAGSVVFPEITEENSVNLDEQLAPAPEYDYSYEEPYPAEPDYSYSYFEAEGYPVINNGVCSVPFRAFADSFGGESNITYDNGVITAMLDGKLLKITANTSLAEHDERALALTGSNNSIKGTLYITEELLEQLGYEIDSIYSYRIDDVVYTDYQIIRR